MTEEEKARIAAAVTKVRAIIAAKTTLEADKAAFAAAYDAVKTGTAAQKATVVTAYLSKEAVAKESVEGASK